MTQDRENPSVLDLLGRHHSGDTAALGQLVERLRPWLWSYVSRKMGPTLRVGEASEDVVHDVLVKVFERGPAFVPASEDQLLRLVATMALNRLRDRYDWMAVRREVSLGITRIGEASSPSQNAAAQEEAGFLELGMALLDPEDAKVVHERNWEGTDFREIGDRRGIAEDAARMRFNRAVRRLGSLVRQLQSGELDDVAPDLPPLSA